MSRNAERKPIRRPRARLWVMLVGVACFAGELSAGETEPTSPPNVQAFDAVYTLRRAGWAIGEVRRSVRLNPDGEHVFEARSRSVGIAKLFIGDVVDERSVWQFAPNGDIRPINYTYDRIGGRKERHATLSFDWEKNLVANTIDGETWRMAIPPHAQDKLLYQLALMLDLERGKRELEYAIADGGKLKTYRFNVIGEADIDTALGKLHTLILERRREDRVTTVWSAPAWHHLPVRLEQSEKDGDDYQMYIESVSGIERR